MPVPYNSTVVLFHDVPLDPMYEHTILFSNVAAQRAYFATKEISQTTTYRNLSYLRHTRGVIRLETDMSLLTNCNYLQFYNPIYSQTASGNEYEDVSFYCFVTDIEYINERTVQISYTIDHMQTWMFYYQLNPCYVEREHTNNDSIGANRVTEGLDTGEYVCPAVERIDHWDSVYSTEDADVIQNTTFVVIATQSPDGSQYSYQFNGVLSSMYIAFAYNTSGLEDILDSFRNGQTGSLEPIISIGMFPSYFKPTTTSPINPVTNTLALDQSVGFGGFFAYDPETETMKTYVPKNNKLYQYPYNYMVFESPDGSTVDLKFENFKSNDVHQFTTWLAILPDIQTLCAPLDYEGNQTGQSNVSRMNLHYAICSKGYPYAAVASDAFNAWWAQNRYSMPIAGAVIDSADAITSSMAKQNEQEVISRDTARANRRGEGYSTFTPSKSNPNLSANFGNMMSGMLDSVMTNMGTPSGVLITGGTAAGVAGDILSGNFGGVGNAAVSIGMDLAAIQGHKAVPDTLVTKANNGGVNHYMEMDCYKIHYIKIRPEYAEIIDNYFTCYGYACHRVKQPNITSRTEWNYIKTKGCTLKKNEGQDRFVPMEAERAIAAIYDKGITFWHNPAHIHNYSYNNTIVT